MGLYEELGVDGMAVEGVLLGDLHGAVVAVRRGAASRALQLERVVVVQVLPAVDACEERSVPGPVERRQQGEHGVVGLHLVAVREEVALVRREARLVDHGGQQCHLRLAEPLEAPILEGRAIAACLRAQEDPKIDVADVLREVRARDVWVCLFFLQHCVLVFAWGELAAAATAATAAHSPVTAAAAAAAAATAAGTAAGKAVQAGPADTHVIEQTQRVLARARAFPHGRHQVGIPCELGVALLAPVLCASCLHVLVLLLELLHVLVDRLVTLDFQDLLQVKVALDVAVDVVHGARRFELAQRNHEARHADEEAGELAEHRRQISLDRQPLQHFRGRYGEL